MGLRALMVAVAMVMASALATADVWDLGSDNDNTALSTDNELVHGLNQVHDLGARVGPTSDQDFYVVDAQSRTSYEVVVDGPTGDLDPLPTFLVRLADDGATQLQTSDGPGGLGFVRSLRWINPSSTLATNYIRVGPGGCTTSCTSDDQYRIRFYDTTIGVARYNNSGTQSTVLITQNNSAQTIDANVYFWNALGALVANTTISLAPRQVSVLSTAALTGATSGSITMPNNAQYGALNVKAVALEPSTGFSFDTPGVYKPY